MLVKTQAKFLYYRMSRKNQGDIFEMDEKDVPDFGNAVVPVVQQSQPAKKRGRPKKVVA